MESDAKLWQYIYYNQNYNLPKERLSNESNSFIETSATTDDQLLNDQLLLHQNNLQRNYQHLNPYAHHEHNHSTRNPNYSKFKLGFDLDCSLKNKTFFKRLIYKFFYIRGCYKLFYKFNYLTLLFFIFILIGFICLVRFSTNYLNSTRFSSSVFSTSLPFSSFKTDFTNATSINTFDQLSVERAEQLVNDRLNSFERVLTVETDCASYIGTVEDSAFEFLGKIFDLFR